MSAEDKAAPELRNFPDGWNVPWDKTGAGYEPGRVNFLQPEYVRRAAGWLGYGDDLRGALLEGLRLFDGAPGLEKLAWHCHAILFAKRGEIRDPFQWPAIPASIHPAAELFYVYVLLSGLDWIRIRHGELGIPCKVTRDTLSDLELWMRCFRERNGRWGLSQFSWLCRHFSLGLVKLGRLQFAFETFQAPFLAFWNRATGRLELVAVAGQAFREDGQFASADGGSAAPAWTSSFDGCSADSRVHASGRVVREAVCFPRGEWRCVLRSGDPVLGVHIPAAGRLDYGECVESFRIAREFFPLHFPGRPYCAFRCGSWLLDPQLGRVLPPSSNVARFQSMWRLYPLPGADGGQTLERVFNAAVGCDIRGLPRDTSMRRAMADFMESGGRPRLGGGLIFPDDPVHNAA